MKILLTFFLLICFHLLDGQDVTSASIYDYEVCDSSDDFDFSETNVAERTGEGQRCLLTHRNDITGQDELSLFVEDDEEDYSRKCKSRIESFSTFYYAYITSYSQQHLTNRFCNCRHPFSISSSKYIAQRVLRI